MAAEYQEPDRRVVDYQAFCLDEGVLDPSTGRPLMIRGPKPERLEAGGYAVVLGAAQAFGRFCRHPFPAILEARLGMPVLNISHGGAGPAFFCRNNERLLSYVNGARFAIVQVMSGRSDSSSRFESDGVGHFRRRSDGAAIGCDEAFAQLIREESRAVVARIVEETRRSWCNSYRRLLSQVSVPTVLLWLSTRPPAYRQGWRNVAELFGAFPQLVDAAMVAEIRRLCDRYVECVGSQGLPQALVDRFTGQPVRIEDPWTAKPWDANWYYPSPEMHEAAANMLAPVCASLSRPQATERRRRVGD
jgi:uncharacterized protein DUF6473